AGPDACHGYTFGRPAVAIEMVVGPLPALTGGEIPLGTYDAVAARTTTSTTGSYRATFVFEDADTLQQLQQISLSGVGPITPRTITYSTSGSMLMRTETCPGGDTPDTGYRVFSDGDGRTRLEIGNAALRFEFVRRGG
ncbi:MAG TPA: hypothetical protein RMG45_15125, partial [Polyangiaceae bacterium LLY-WYZ-15_(1-7)]|nr:hypothetical protein [Polyangiaceae bacterium LLY-WYZ-15_(1-7)]